METKQEPMFVKTYMGPDEQLYIVSQCRTFTSLRELAKDKTYPDERIYLLKEVDAKKSIEQERRDIEVEKHNEDRAKKLAQFERLKKELGK